MTNPLRTLIRILLPALLLVAAAPAAPASAARQVTFGAWTPGSPFGGDLSATKALERSLKRRVQIVSWYQDWSVDGAHFRWNVKKAVRGVRRSKRTPLLTWEPFKYGSLETNPLQAIASGAWDGYIRWWARKVKRLRKPVYVRLAHEMNGNWYSWGGPVADNSARKYRAMWRRVVRVSRSVDAHNIRWVWSPLTENVPNVPSNRFQRYYPGTRYVDVLALDGYNWGSDRPDYGGWRSFKTIFRKPYKKIGRLGPQPIWIAEVGSASEGGSKSNWVRDMWRVASRWDRLKAIIWFNQDGDQDWSTASAASAFNAPRRPGRG